MRRKMFPVRFLAEAQSKCRAMRTPKEVSEWSARSMPDETGAAMAHKMLSQKANGTRQTPSAHVRPGETLQAMGCLDRRRRYIMTTIHEHHQVTTDSAQLIDSIPDHELMV